MHEKITLALLAIIAVATLLFVDEPPPDKTEYCEMWGIWHVDRRAGVPIDKRYGWPDPDGKYYKECTRE